MATLEDEMPTIEEFIKMVNGIVLHSAEDEKRMTTVALLNASEHGDIDKIRMLIEKGADINMQSNTGWTALHEATYSEHIDIVKLLIEHGANINMQINYGHTALHLASLRRNIAIVKLLIEYGINPNIQLTIGHRKDTALQITPKMCKQIIDILTPLTTLND